MIPARKTPLQEARLTGHDGTQFLVRAMANGTLEITDTTGRHGLWIAPNSAVNVVEIVPVELFASRDRRPLVRDPEAQKVIQEIEDTARAARAHVVGENFESARRALTRLVEAARSLRTMQ